MLIADIETAPSARGMATPYPTDRQAPSNYKDPEKIAAWHLKDEADWRAGLAKECALSARLGRVVAVGFRTNGTSHCITAIDPEDEAKVVAFLLNEIARADRVVTFNGLSFDLPYLHVRAAILGLRIPYNAGQYLRRYVTNPHADLRAILTNWDSRVTGTLTEWCSAFGIENGDTTTGADIGAMVERGDADGIFAHCQHDLAATHALAEKCEAAGMI